MLFLCASLVCHGLQRSAGVNAISMKLEKYSEREGNWGTGTLRELREEGMPSALRSFVCDYSTTYQRQVYAPALGAESRLLLLPVFKGKQLSSGTLKGSLVR